MNREETYKMVRKLEGGWYDGSQPYDPNPTKWGITQNTYEQYGFTGSVEFMTEEECALIYDGYWQESEAEMFDYWNAPLVFDHAFNAGYVNMRKVVQRALGVEDDGVWGPVTRQAIYNARRNGTRLAVRLVFERLDYYRMVALLNPKKRPALLSWITRLMDYYRLVLQRSL